MPTTDPTRRESPLSKSTMSALNKAGEIKARSEKEAFESSLYFICTKNIESPIEQILYIALSTIKDVYWGSDSLTIQYQQEIGKYRVDFEVICTSISGGGKRVVVECDSQAFHERTEQERRYEKARDRFLQKQGYRAFHYTGKEIIEQPFRIASEIVAFVCDEEFEHVFGCYENYANA